MEHQFLYLDKDRHCGKFVFNNENPQLKLSGIDIFNLILNIKTFQFTSLQITNTENPSDLSILIEILRVTENNIKIDARLKDYITEFRYVDKKHILDTRNIDLFSIPCEGFINIEITSLQKQFSLEMYFDLILK